MMIEPTESEDIYECDRFVDSLLQIREEIQQIIDGKQDKELNTLKLAPFTLKHLMQTDWPYKFTREQAGYPGPW